MIKIILHGYLKDIAPSGLSFEAANVKEAMELFCNQQEALRAGLGKKMHRVRIAGFETRESLVAPTDVEEIHVVPSLHGGKSGLVQIVIGVVLIAAAIIMPASIAGLALTSGGTTLGSITFALGAALVLGGVAQMLAPAPTIDTQTSDPEASKILPSQQNTVKIGTRIPLGYGRHKVFGHYLSFNVQSTDIIYATLK